jgi:archaemetzincin
MQAAKNVPTTVSNSPGAKEGLIAVIPLGRVPQDVMQVVASGLQGVLRLPVDVLDGAPLPSESYMEDRNQFNALTIMKRLIDMRPPGALKILGVTGKDLGNPILTYVFGEAYMGGVAAVLSFFRLHRGRDSEFAPREVFLDRVGKVALHEIGHTFGLPHCHQGRCVMRASNKLDELDDKFNYLCDYCRLFLLDAVNAALKSKERE